jgi:hypothetical protein
MSYFLNPVEEKQCLFLTCEGSMPEVQAEDAWKALCALLERKRWHRAVVDLRATQSSKSEDLFNLGISLLRNMPRNARVALIVRWDHAKYAGLLERTAWNAEVYLTCFVDTEEAEAWVQSDTPDRNQARTTARIQNTSMKELQPKRTI